MAKKSEAPSFKVVAGAQSTPPEKDSLPEKTAPIAAAPAPKTVKDCWERLSSAQDEMIEALDAIKARVEDTHSRVERLEFKTAVLNVGDLSPVAVAQLRESVLTNRRALIALRNLFDSHERDIEKGRKLVKKYSI